MSPDIKTKIKAVLRQEQYSERDVVYFLVESYKLLERQYERAFGAGTYDRIKFYRNWACHSELRGDSKKVFENFIELIRAEHAKPNAVGHFDWIDMMTEKIKECFRNYGPLLLKSDIEDFIKEIEYDGTFNWESFRTNLYEVIRDIKLAIKDGEETVFTFECVEPLAQDLYNHLTLKAVIAGEVEFSFALDDRSL